MVTSLDLKSLNMSVEKSTTVVALYYDVKISVVITRNLYFPYKDEIFFSQYAKNESVDRFWIRCCTQNQCSRQKKQKNIQNIYCLSTKFLI